MKSLLLVLTTMMILNGCVSAQIKFCEEVVVAEDGSSMCDIKEEK